MREDETVRGRLKAIVEMMLAETARWRDLQGRNYGDVFALVGGVPRLGKGSFDFRLARFVPSRIVL